MLKSSRPEEGKLPRISGERVNKWSDYYSSLPLWEPRARIIITREIPFKTMRAIARDKSLVVHANLRSPLKRYYRRANKYGVWYVE